MTLIQGSLKEGWRFINSIRICHCHGNSMHINLRRVQRHSKNFNVTFQPVLFVEEMDTLSRITIVQCLN